MATRTATNPTPMIGRYEVVAKLGEGGMAETWLCRLHGTRGFQRRVVVKTLKAEHLDQPEYHSMFTDEARVGAALAHPAIPRVEELGEHAGVPFMVQEYVEGPSLYQILKAQRRRGRLDHRLASRIVADVARALHHGYTATDEAGRLMKVVHRDVSPSNVLVSVKGQAKLIDYGVARFVDRETRTEAGVLKGKLRYMAPEAILRGVISHQSDLYALGVIFYALLVGRHAWKGDQDVAARLEGRFTPPSDVSDDVPPELEAIVMRCLEVNPADRFASGAELAAALETWLEENGGPMSDSDVAGRLDALFPGGPDEWRTGHAIDPTHSFGTPAQGDRRLGRAWLPLLGVGVLGLAVIGVGALAVVVVGGLGAREAVRPPPEVAAPAPNPAVERAKAAATLLDAAERALAEGDEAEAASRMRALAGLELTDADLLERRAKLETELDIASQIRAAGHLVGIDPEAALARAIELDAAHPGRPEVTALLERARAAAGALPPAPAPRVAPRSPAPARPEPVVVAPAPRPEPAPPPVDRDELLVPDFGEAPASGLLDPFGGTSTEDEGLKDPFAGGGDR